MASIEYNVEKNQSFNEIANLFYGSESAGGGLALANGLDVKTVDQAPNPKNNAPDPKDPVPDTIKQLAIPEQLYAHVQTKNKQGRTVLHVRKFKRISCKIALTFDDGPNPKTTNQILDVLESHKIPAVFFVLGDFFDPNLDQFIKNNNWTRHAFDHGFKDGKRHVLRFDNLDYFYTISKDAEGNEHLVPKQSVDRERLKASIAARYQVLDRIKSSKAGHKIGCHMYWHQQHAFMPVAEVERGLLHSKELLKDYLWNIARLPYVSGMKNKAICEMFRKNNFNHLFWDYNQDDWRIHSSAENLSTDFIQRLRWQIRTAFVKRELPGGVVLFHDINANTANRLDSWIRHLRDDLGHQFVSLEEVTDFTKAFGGPVIPLAPCGS